MGSCISKCKPKKKSKEEDECRHIQDKLVITQDPPITSEFTKIPSEKPLSPAPSISSTSSFSSFSPSINTKYTVASSSSSSLSSSSSSSYIYPSAALKDRSFSNDFLRSCAKENPHAITLKEKTPPFPNKTAVSSPLTTKTTTVNTAARKRMRASSPTLMRQKSFRREQSFACSTPNRGLRSPSPSRRFNGESNGIFPVRESCYRKAVTAVSSTPKRESFRAPIPSPSRRNDAFSQNICSKEIDDDVFMEDINNPLIALDCFIFL